MKFSNVDGQHTSDSSDTNTSDALSNRRIQLLKRQLPRTQWNHNTFQNIQYVPASTTKKIHQTSCDGDRKELYCYRDISSAVPSLPLLSDTTKISEGIMPLQQRYRRHSYRHHHRRQRRSTASSSKNVYAIQPQHIIYMLLFLTLLIMNLSFLFMHQNYYGTTTEIILNARRRSNNFIHRELSAMIHPRSRWLPQQQHQQSLQSDITRIDRKHGTEYHTNAQRGMTYYSRGRRDRSGAVVHDMLWVHAYAYSQNGTYGGACGGPSYNDTNFLSMKPKVMTYQNVTQELINQLRWNLALKYACPTNYSNSSTEVIVERDFYTNLDASIFTPQWKKYFQGQVSAAASLASLTSSSSFNRRKDQIDQSGNAVAVSATKREKVLRRTTHQGTEIVDSHVHIRSNTTNNDDNVYTIAVHIRRGDVDPCTYMNRYLSNSYYLRLIKKYYKQVPIQYQTVNVDIYSESSSYESFDVFRNVYKYNVHLDDTLSNVWKALSTANVAILSKSSFSYVPAISNPNTVVYTSYRHLPLPSWDVVDRVVSDEENRAIKKIHDSECGTVNIK